MAASPRLSHLLAATLAAASARPGGALAQDATVAISFKNGSQQGLFNNTSSSATRVQVRAESTPSAQYSSGFLYTPTVGKSGPGATFALSISGLTSVARQPNNRYFINYQWPDTTTQKRQLGPYALKAGANTVGAGGLGSATPIEVINMPPPAAMGLNCYPDLPDQSTNLYLYWSSPGFFEDFNQLSIYLSTMANFTPSPQSLVASGLVRTTANRKIGMLKPDTDYYFCIRITDEYGAVTDACRAQPCRTKPGMVMPDLATPRDLALPPDLAQRDLTMPPADLAASVDLAPPSDLAAPPDLATSPDLATPPDLAASADLAAPPDLAAPADLAEPPDLAAPADLTEAIDLAAPPVDLGVADDLAAAADGAPPSDGPPSPDGPAAVDGAAADGLVPPGQESGKGGGKGNDVGGCAIARRGGPAPLALFVGLALLLALRGRRRR